MAERESNHEDYYGRFSALPPGGSMNLPFGVLKPSVPDSGTSPRLDIPGFTVYPADGILWIDDGNRRYYKMKREGVSSSRMVLCFRTDHFRWTE